MSATTGVAWATIMPAIQAWVMRGSGLDSAHVVYAPQPGAPRPSGPYVAMRIATIDTIGDDWFAREPNVITVPTIAVTSIDTASSTLIAPAHGRVTGDGPLELDASLTLPEPLTPGQPLWAIVVDPDTLQIAADFFDAMSTPPTPIALATAGAGTITIDGTGNTVRAGQEVQQHTRGPRIATLELTAFAGTGGAGVGAASPLAMIDGILTAAGLESVLTALAAAGVGVGTWDRPRAIGAVVNATEFEPRAIVAISLNLASSCDETSTFIERVNAVGTIGNATVDIDVSD